MMPLDAAKQKYNSRSVLAKAKDSKTYNIL